MIKLENTDDRSSYLDDFGITAGLLALVLKNIGFAIWEKEVIIYPIMKWLKIKPQDTDFKALTSMLTLKKPFETVATILF